MKPSFDSTAGRTAPRNYEQHFVPAIGMPCARDLVETAQLHQGEKILDVACGTGVVARLAKEEVDPGGTVVGVDVNAGMLEVARSVTPVEKSIQWYEAPAETMPLPDETFDVVLCQMSFQFFTDKQAALREMLRVMAPDARLAIGVPGEIPEIMRILADGLSTHIDASLGGFVHQVFSLSDPGELRDLLDQAGFSDTESSKSTKALQIPPPEQFLWQYIYSTPLSKALAQADRASRDALQREVVPKWRRFADNGGMNLDLEIVVATGRK